MPILSCHLLITADADHPEKDTRIKPSLCDETIYLSRTKFRGHPTPNLEKNGPPLGGE